MAHSLSPLFTGRLVRVAETLWRSAAASHSHKIRDLLEPGLTDPSDDINSGLRMSRRQSSLSSQLQDTSWTALDSRHPVYNFLIEYYGLKGARGPRRLARWSPCPSLLLSPTTSEIVADGILLEGADFSLDLGGTLHPRGAVPHTNGIVYNPSAFFGKGDPSRRNEAQKAIIPFLWYRSVLQQTLKADPVLHCHGLHEWAMQYQPKGSPPPPSAKYQAHLPLRVPRDTINEVVERKGVRCTHVDALKYFAPAAGPLSHHGVNLGRTEQLRLEQPACVHAHMDLIKISLRLQPFLSADVLSSAVAIALRARRLDLAASPYDATAYGVGVVPIETPEGRSEYREKQKELMQDAEIVRQRVLQAYETFLHVAFDSTLCV